MDVLLCAACGRPLTRPVRLLPGLPDSPAWDGLPGPDGLRRAPARMPRGTYAADPLPYGAPFVPAPDDEEYDGVVPGGKRTSDERGLLVSAGPRGTWVLHPLDAAELDAHPDRHRHIGCCGPCGEYRADRLCPCGAEVAITAGDRTTDHEVRFVPESVRVTTAPAGEGTA
ncbi:hypothetical protein [Streptomyces spiralis]|uniref:hypothetical protein n=1 Tax=Streptomyces spiralis TaxID=66376 RepID=UPI0036A76196